MAGRIYADTSVIGGCEDEEFRVHSRRLMGYPTIEIRSPREVLTDE